MHAENVPGKLILLEHEILSRLYRELPLRATKALRILGIEYWKESPEACLIWLQWSRRYGIGFDLLVRKLAEHYRGLLGISGRSLGVVPSTMAGPSAEQFVSGLHAGRESSPPSLHASSISEYAAQMRRLRQGTTPEKSYRGSPSWGKVNGTLPR